MEQNRQEARRLLEEQLDLAINGNKSFISQQKVEAREWKHGKKKRARDKLSLKKDFKNKNESDIL